MQSPKQVSLSFMLMGIVFCVCLVASNLLETKIILLEPIPFIGSVAITAGFLVFPISYIINDVIAEVWGFRKVRLVIWMGFLMNFFVVLLGKAAIALPAAPFWKGEEHFDFVFGLAPRIAAASLLAFVIGSFLNAWVMSRMKVMSQGKNFSVRAVASTLVGETADSLIFFPIAFYGYVEGADMLRLMLTQVIAKTLYEIVVLPVTIQVVKFVKRREQTNVFDENVSYNILKIGEI